MKNCFFFRLIYLVILLILFLSAPLNGLSHTARPLFFFFAARSFSHNIHALFDFDAEENQNLTKKKLLQQCILTLTNGNWLRCANNNPVTSLNNIHGRTLLFNWTRSLLLERNCSQLLVGDRVGIVGSALNGDVCMRLCHTLSLAQRNRTPRKSRTKHSKFVYCKLIAISIQYQFYRITEKMGRPDSPGRWKNNFILLDRTKYVQIRRISMFRYHWSHPFANFTSPQTLMFSSRLFLSIWRHETTWCNRSEAREKKTFSRHI